MRFPLAPLTAALYSRLKDEQTLEPKASVFSYSAPMDISSPYIDINQFACVPVGSKTSSDFEVTGTLNIYAGEGELAWMDAAMSEVIRLIQRAPLVLTNDWRDVGPQVGRVQAAEVLPYFEETQGVVLLQGIVRYTWRIEDVQSA